MIKSIIGEVLSRKGSSTHRLGQSAVVPGAWFSVSYKVLKYGHDSLHKACSVQQGTHQGAWQFLHFAWPKFSDCQQSDTKLETLRKTDWQHPTNTTDDMSDTIHYSILGKT